MHTHRLEFYMDSYASEPIVNETPEQFKINIGDELNKQDWAELLPGAQNQMDLTVRVLDIQHQFWDCDDFIHSTSIKVIPVA